MQTSDIRGIIPAIVTPFNDDETINEAELRNQVRRQLDAGAHGLFPGGTNGEFYALSGDERQFVLEVVLDETRRRIPVYAGTGAVTTRESIDLSKRAAAAGADALSLVTPYYGAASQEELVAHFTAVARAVDLPVVIYNIPARTGNVIKPETVGRLAHVDNIVGVKDSSGDWDNLLAYLEQGGDKLAVLCGNDSLILRGLQAGAAGSITGVANVYPETMVGIYEAWRAGDEAKAQEFQDSIANLRAVFKHGNPNTVVKIATRLLGYEVGQCRAPFNRLPEFAVEELKGVLNEDAARGIK